jgi:hypothetical protein
MRIIFLGPKKLSFRHGYIYNMLPAMTLKLFQLNSFIIGKTGTTCDSVRKYHAVPELLKVYFIKETIH